jgi:hypothetical protein
MTDEERLKGLRRMQDNMLRDFTLRMDPKPKHDTRPMFRALIAGLVLLGAVLLATHATAQVSCMPREAMRAQLHDTYGESVRVVAMGPSGARLEMWINDTRQTWTLTQTSAIGLTCMVAAGTGVAILPAPVKPAEAL